jgi:2,3-bisphosphoglycerate-independent phosphoglycerate mutase
MREIVSIFGIDPKPPNMKVTVPENLVSNWERMAKTKPNPYLQNITTMSRYNGDFPFPVAFPPQGMADVLAEWLSKQGIKQMHVAGE